VRAAEQLIEAAEYATEEKEYWWEQFASRAEAAIILKQARQCEVDEYEVIRLATALDIDSPDNSYSLTAVYQECLATLKKQMHLNDS
jgi:hypothetical protein